MFVVIILYFCGHFSFTRYYNNNIIIVKCNIITISRVAALSIITDNINMKKKIFFLNNIVQKYSYKHDLDMKYK